jgi:hypothetical protein
VKRWLLSLLFLSLGLAIGFIGGARWGSSTAAVSLSIVNSTSQPVTSVRVTHQNGTELVGDILPSATRRVQFLARGETHYSLSAILGDGSRVESGQRYVESGYHVTERITDRTIELHASY